MRTTWWLCCCPQIKSLIKGLLLCLNVTSYCAMMGTMLNVIWVALVVAPWGTLSQSDKMERRRQNTSIYTRSGLALDGTHSGNNQYFIGTSFGHTIWNQTLTTHYALPQLPKNQSCRLHTCLQLDAHCSSIPSSVASDSSRDSGNGRPPCRRTTQGASNNASMLSLET